jgi:hypothetical protein
MAFSFATASMLGPAYQPAIFWADIPPLMGSAENMSRFAMITLSAFLILRFDSPRQRLGLILFGLGLVCYAGSYGAMILAPDSTWSRSLVGFSAPAYTTLPWIAGIGLIGQKSFLPRADWLKFCYVITATVFVVAHTSHTILIYIRAA